MTNKNGPGELPGPFLFVKFLKKLLSVVERVGFEPTIPVLPE